jgi:hypothetical protein
LNEPAGEKCIAADQERACPLVLIISDHPIFADFARHVGDLRVISEGPQLTMGSSDHSQGTNGSQ